MLKNFIQVMKTLSDPNRVKTIKNPATKSMCLCARQGAIALAQPAVFKRLKIREKGIGCRFILALKTP
jgi:hypothetical protein